MATRYEQGILKLELEAAFSDGAAAHVYWPQRGGRINTGDLIQTHHDRDSMRAQNAPYKGIVGTKSDSKLSLAGWLHGWSNAAVTALPLAAQYAACIDARILASALGGVWYHTVAVEGSVEAAPAPSKTAFTITAGTGANYTPGQCVTIDVSATATPKYECGWIKTIAVDAITLRTPLSAAPAAGKSLWGSITCFQPLNDFQTQALGGTFQGQRAAEYYAIKGIEATSLKMNYTPKDFLTIDIEAIVNDWVRSAGAAPLPAALQGPDREPMINSVCRFWAAGDPDSTNLDVSTFAIDWGLNTIPILDPAGTQGRKRSAIGMCAPTIKINPLAADESWITKYEAGTLVNVDVQDRDGAGQDDRLYRAELRGPQDAEGGGPQRPGRLGSGAGADALCGRQRGHQRAVGLAAHRCHHGRCAGIGGRHVVSAALSRYDAIRLSLRSRHRLAGHGPDRRAR